MERRDTSFRWRARAIVAQRFHTACGDGNVDLVRNIFANSEGDILDGYHGHFYKVHKDGGDDDLPNVEGSGQDDEPLPFSIWAPQIYRRSPGVEPGERASEVLNPHILLAPPIGIACLEGRNEVVELLLERGADPNEDSATIPQARMGTKEPKKREIYTCLYFARHNTQLIKILVDAGADVNRCITHFGGAPTYQTWKDLLSKCMWNFHHGKQAWVPDWNDVGHSNPTLPLEYLFRGGLQVDAVDGWMGMTPLATSSLNPGMEHILRELLRRGADVNKANPQTGVSALFYAASSSTSGNVELLMRNGACATMEPVLPDVNRPSPLEDTISTILWRTRRRGDPPRNAFDVIADEDEEIASTNDGWNTRALVVSYTQSHLELMRLYASFLKLKCARQVWPHHIVGMIALADAGICPPDVSEEDVDRELLSPSELAKMSSVSRRAQITEKMVICLNVFSSRPLSPSHDVDVLQKVCQAVFTNNLPPLTFGIKLL